MSETAPKPKIFIYATEGGFGPFDVYGNALAEDGECLAGHISSSIEWSKHDMGITSDWKHENYQKKYPEGYELEWIDYEDLEGHEAFNVAYKLNREQAEAAEAVTA